VPNLSGPVPYLERLGDWRVAVNPRVQLDKLYG